MTRAAFLVRLVAAAMVVAVAGYALQRWSWHPFRCASMVSAADAALERAERGAAAERQRVARSVRAGLQRCACASPALEVRTQFVIAEAATELGDHRGAVAAYEHALTVDRRPELYFALGLAQLNALDRGAALDNLARACAFDPARLRGIPYDDVRAEIEQRLTRNPGLR
jgi:tetratricopeptide (TPR) repeat protein